MSGIALTKSMADAGSKAGTILHTIRYLGKNNLSDIVFDKLAGKLNYADNRMLKSIARYASD